MITLLGLAIAVVLLALIVAGTIHLVKELTSIVEELIEEEKE